MGTLDYIKIFSVVVTGIFVILTKFYEGKRVASRLTVIGAVLAIVAGVVAQFYESSQSRKRDQQQSDILINLERLLRPLEIDGLRLTFGLDCQVKAFRQYCATATKAQYPEPGVVVGNPAWDNWPGGPRQEIGYTISIYPNQQSALDALTGAAAGRPQLEISGYASSWNYKYGLRPSLGQYIEEGKLSVVVHDGKPNISVDGSLRSSLDLKGKTVLIQIGDSAKWPITSASLDLYIRQELPIEITVSGPPRKFRDTFYDLTAGGTDQTFTRCVFIGQFPK